MTHLARWADWHATNGTPVFPVWGVDGDRCDCGVYPCGPDNRNAGKHPVGGRGYHDATLDPDTITAWWSEYPNANIGGRPPEGVVVVDVDSRNHGGATLLDLADGAALPGTRTTRTGDGLHIWLRHDGPARGKLGPGLDVKTHHNGYVLMPGSRHRTGRYYEPHGDPSAPIADAPRWLDDLLDAGGTRPEQPVTTITPPLPVKLPEQWEHKVRTGDTDGYPSRSELQAALVHPTIAAGGTIDDYLTMLTHPGNGISARHLEHLDARGSEAAHAELRRTWHRLEPQHQPGKPTAEQVAARWTAAVPLLADATPTARQWPTTLAVWWALTHLSVTKGTHEPLASRRHLETLAGVAGQTVISTLNRLRRPPGGVAALLTQTARGDGNHGLRKKLGHDGGVCLEGDPTAANCYTLTPAAAQVGPDCYWLYVSNSLVQAVHSPAAPMWRGRYGRGHLGWLLYCLTYSPDTSEDVLAAGARCSLRTARRHLQVLAVHDDAVFESSPGVWTPTGVDPAEQVFPDAERSRDAQHARIKLDRQARSETKREGAA